MNTDQEKEGEQTLNPIDFVDAGNTAQRRLKAIVHLMSCASASEVSDFGGEDLGTIGYLILDLVDPAFESIGTLHRLYEEANLTKEKAIKDVQTKIDNLTAKQKHLEQGRSFLDANRFKKGVKSLPSGLQYKILKKGDGPIPKPTDEVTVNHSGTAVYATYNGILLEGHEFENTFRSGKPETFRVDTAIKGLAEALQLMAVGSKWQIMIPPELGYGDLQVGEVPPQSTLIIEVELLSITRGMRRDLLQ